MRGAHAYGSLAICLHKHIDAKHAADARKGRCGARKTRARDKPTRVGRAGREAEEKAHDHPTVVGSQGS